MSVDQSGESVELQIDQLVSNFADTERKETWFVVDSCKFDIQNTPDIKEFKQNSFKITISGL